MVSDSQDVSQFWNCLLCRRVFCIQCKDLTIEVNEHSFAKEIVHHNQCVYIEYLELSNKKIQIIWNW